MLRIRSIESELLLQKERRACHWASFIAPELFPVSPLRIPPELPRDFDDELTDSCAGAVSLFPEDAQEKKEIAQIGSRNA